MIVKTVLIMKILFRTGENNVELHQSNKHLHTAYNKQCANIAY